MDLFSLLGNIKHCKLFNLTMLMSQRRAGSCRRWHMWGDQKGDEENESATQKQKWRNRRRCMSVNGQKRGTEWGQNQKEKHACAHRTFVEDKLHTPECCKPSAQKQPRARGEAESTHLSEHNLLGRANSCYTAPLFICVYPIFTAMSCSLSILSKKNAR